MEITGSASTASFSFLISFVPSFTISPFAGVLMDRYDRRKAMILVDLTRMGVALLLGISLLRGFASLELVMFYFFIRSLGDTFYRAASEVMIPNIVDSSLLMQANGVRQAADMGGGVLGPLAAGLIFEFIGMHAVFLLDSLLFVFSIIALLNVRLTLRSEGATKAALSVKILFSEIGEALLYIRKRPVIMQLMLTFAIANMSSASVNVMMPFYIAERLGGMADFTAISSATAVGGLLIGLIASVMRNIRHRGKLMVIAILLNTIGQVIFGFSSILYLSMAISMLRAFSGIASSMASSTIYQDEVEDYIRGRVFTFRVLLVSALMPVGVALAGVMSGFMPAWMVISATGVIGVVGSLAAIFYKELWNA
jgi:MFS family permease